MTNLKPYYDNRGFTLVEILVVVAIIGILATIAIPQFSLFRQKAFCSEVVSDISNLARHQEAYYLANETYVAVTRNADGSSNVANHKWTSGVTLVSASGDISGWIVTADHPNCTDGPYTYNSSAGGLQ